MRFSERVDAKILGFTAPWRSLRGLDLSLPIESVEQGGADRLRISGQVVELLVALTRKTSRRHVKIASKIERHRAVQNAAHGRDVIVATGDPDPLKHLVDRVGIGKYGDARSRNPSCSFALPKGRPGAPPHTQVIGQGRPTARGCGKLGQPS